MTAVDFGSLGNLPLELARQIWSYFSIKKRTQLERVCRTWQWPNMSYREVTELKITFESPDELEPFVKWLRRFLERVGPHLEAFSLPSYRPTPKERLSLSVTLLPDIISLLGESCPKLWKLEIPYFQRMIFDDDFNARGEYVASRRPTKLEKLKNLFNRKKSDTDVRLPSTLRSLRLLTSSELPHLRSSLNYLENLELLDLQTRDRHSLYLAGDDEIMLNLPRLRVLASVDQPVDLPFLCQNSSLLEVLWLKYPKDLSKAQISVIFSLHHLRSLDMCSIYPSNVAWTDDLLAELCQCCPLLEDLCLACTGIKGFSPLLDLCHLKSLNVNFCEHFDSPICNRLLRRRTLTKLCIWKTGIEDHEIAQIFGHSSLRTLMLSGREYVTQLNSLKEALNLSLVCYVTSPWDAPFEGLREALTNFLIFRKEVVQQGVHAAHMKFILAMANPRNDIFAGLTMLAEQANVTFRMNSEFAGACICCEEFKEEKVKLFLC